MTPARRLRTLAAAALIGASAVVPATAQAQGFYDERIVERSFERTIERRAVPVAPVAPVRDRRLDDGAALAIGVIGGLALGAIAAPHRDPLPAYGYAPPPPRGVVRAHPGVIEAPRRLPPRHVGRFEPGWGAPVCDVLERRVVDSWGRVSFERVRVCR